MVQAHDDDVHFGSAEFDVSPVHPQFWPPGDDDVAPVDDELGAFIGTHRIERPFGIPQADERSGRIAEDHLGFGGGVTVETDGRFATGGGGITDGPVRLGALQDQGGFTAFHFLAGQRLAEKTG